MRIKYEVDTEPPNNSLTLMQVYIGNRSNGGGSGFANSLFGALAGSHPLFQQPGAGGAAGGGQLGDYAVGDITRYARVRARTYARAHVHMHEHTQEVPTNYNRFVHAFTHTHACT